MKIIKEHHSSTIFGGRVPLRLKPVKMKNSLYLLVPKGISELLEIDQNRECVLTTTQGDPGPILKYSFTSPVQIHRNEGRGARKKHVSKPMSPLQEPAA